MKLIVDSGSTKSHWCIVNNGKVIKELFSEGINPYYQSELEITNSVHSVFFNSEFINEVDTVFFYGAGCAFDEKKLIVSTAINSVFRNASVSVESDLLGAAISLFADGNGIACILGTGSNSCLFDGRSIISNVSPLGFILGDEGSGAVIAKNFLADCLKNQLSEKLKTDFFHEYSLDAASILESVYKKPFPNRFLAQFSPFISKHITDPQVYNLVYNCFEAFIKRNLLQYPIEDQEVGFVGSVAFYYEEVLRRACEANGIRISSIEKSPMQGLISFHSK